MSEIKMGDKVTDIITDYKGVVVARVEYLNGCVQFCVKPKVGKDGKLVEGEYIDEDQLKVTGSILDKAKAPKPVQRKPGGEYMPDCPKR